MKKFFTLLAGLACTAALNAATLNWSVSQMDLANNTALDGVTITLNDNLSLSFANAEATENNYIRYRKVTAMPEPGIAFYSKNEITLTATDATITSVKFIVLTEAESDATPGWKVKAGSTTLSAEDGDTWTGSESSLLIVANSKTTLTGLVIEYTPKNDTPSTPVQPGESTSATWAVSSIQDIANNALIGGNSYDINANLVVSFANGECKEGQEVKYRKVSAMPEPGIALYARNEMTLTATDAKINSVKFLVLTDEAAGSDATPGWKVKAGDTTLSAEDGDTWTGSASELLVVSNSKTTITGLVIEYTIDGGGENPGGGDEPDEPEVPGDFESASLFFNGDLIGKGEIAQNVTLSDNGVSVTFTSNSASAEIDDITFYYGSEEEYTPIQYRYRPGGKSSNGVNSNNKGVFTFPCDGTLYLYAFNNQSGDARSLQLIQNDVTIFDHEYLDSDYEEAPNPNPEAENATIKVWPVLHVDVKKGQATLLWPVNQVMISGFEFVPAESGNQGGEAAVEVVVVEFDENAPAYDITGRKVNAEYRGIVIQNGKKFIRR